MSKPSAQIYTYTGKDPLYGLAWSVRQDKPCRFALGSFIEDSQNYIDIIQYDGAKDAMVVDPRLRLKQSYPATKVLFLPSTATAHSDLVAATSDCLRVWKLTDDASHFERLFDGKEAAVAPLTSFDWASQNVAKLIACSIDNMCYLWDIESGQLSMKIHAHKQPVYDVSWGTPDVFASCSADGSARIVDTRQGDQSTLIYEHSSALNNTTAPAQPTALVRLAWNLQDPCHLAVLPARSASTFLVDVRRPTQPLVLETHTATVNAFDLSPASATQICTAGDDHQALIWDTGRHSSGVPLEPALSYNAAAEVVALQWSTLSPEHIAIAYECSAQVLHV